MKHLKPLAIGLLFLFVTVNTRAQSTELQQLILNVTKLEQLKAILKTMKDGYTTLSKGYNAVKDLSQGNFDLHQVFLDNLLQVSPTVKNYYRVYEIIQKQKSITSEYRNAFTQFKSMNVFNDGQLRYMEDVYTGLIKRSAKELDDLIMVLTAGELRMNDAERLKTIDKIDANVSDQLNFLRYFNKNNNITAIQKYRSLKDLESLRAIYGITP